MPALPRSEKRVRGRDFNYFAANEVGSSHYCATLRHGRHECTVSEDGISNFEALQPPPDKVERFCNAVAAEFLVPALEMKSCWGAPQRADEPYQYLAKRFTRPSAPAHRTE